MTSLNNGHHTYPSPSTDNAPPFYQNHLTTERVLQQNGDTITASELDMDSQRGVPDDPQLRANLASMMGSFDNYTGTLMHQSDLTSGFRPAQHPDAYSQQANAFNSLSHGDPSSKDPKRVKVSRACDECRRKKVRCDAEDETVDMPCSNCHRLGIKCAFTRQPLRRGPNKGYIKELAERLQSLEQQVQPSQQQRVETQNTLRYSIDAGIEDQQQIREPRTGDKRTYDIANSPPGGQSWMNMQNGGGNGRPSSRELQLQFSNLALPFWQRGASLEFRTDSDRLSYEGDGSAVTPNFDWDEGVVDEYYRLIHQTFPLLPNNKSRLRQRLTDCPASLREAFLAALDCLIRGFPTTILPPNPNYAQALKRTAEQLAKYPFDNPSSHTTATNLVYLQTLLLMAMDGDNHGPATIRGQAGPSRAEWLGRAAGVAGQLEINLLHTRNQSIMDGDRDSEERLARRAWWVLFILDRWHASSTADLLKLPENSVVLLPEDQMLLGESTYHLARLSFIIGHLATILTTTKTPSTDVMAPSNPASSLLGLTLAGEIDRFRESVESVWGSLNLVHLSYHHCHLLIKRMNPVVEPTELVGHAVKVATVLNSRLTPVTPLNHHFGALAAMTLCELCDVPKTRIEAIKGLEQMVECLGEGRGLAGKQKSEGWDGAVRELVVKKMESIRIRSPNGLHSQAETAFGGPEKAFNPTSLTRYGYLISLGQGEFERRNIL